MGLLQRAVETYETMEHLAGVFEEGKIEPLAPVGHICKKATLEVTINREGEFIQARKINKTIIIPVTEKSFGRTSTTVAPHPLCDQLGYIAGNDKAKKTDYLKQLQDWIQSDGSNIKLDAIFAYVKNGTIIDDLSKSELLKYDEDNHISNYKDLVCWRVAGDTEKDTAVWTDRELHKSFQKYNSHKNGNEPKDISMISGNLELNASQHLKGVFSLAGNAKIISSNDSTNFTYRGRFLNPKEALTIGYIDSQKGHNALKWLIANQGVTIGKRVFVCWNPQGNSKGNQLPSIFLPIFKKTDQKKPSDYKNDLYRAIMNYKSNLPDGSQVVVAAMEAATSGRLAVTYYNELQGSLFLDRLCYWDETCCWYDSTWGTSSPTLRDIVCFAFGTQRGEDNSKVEADDRLISQHIQRLLISKLNGISFPIDIVRALVQRTYQPLCYNRKNRNRLLFITSAVIRKYRIDCLKEECSMALEPKKEDRSYQFGRLLAVLEKAEKDTYRKDEERETNAIRMQSVFVQRPGYATKIIIDQLKSAYYPKLSVGGRVYYDKLIGEIMEIISETEEAEYNKPLEDTYILGYYLQKNVFYTKNTTDKENE